MADKEAIIEIIKIKNSLLVEGLRADPDIFRFLPLGETIKEQVHGLFIEDHEVHTGIDFPETVILPGNIEFEFRWDNRSPYSLEYHDGQFQILLGTKLLFDNVNFAKRSAYYDKKTSDGIPMQKIASDCGHGSIFITYSNECSLINDNKGCLFCNLNETHKTYGQCQHIERKTSLQIAETVAAAYSEGFNKLTISGGFVPERREVEYYVDVAQAITDKTGLTDFNGTAVIGAPADFTVYDKYKEAGYRTVATNMEIWDENLSKTICPGKYVNSGGKKRWVDALLYAVDVFGKYKVRSQFVSGLESKEGLLEGIEYLVSRGVVAIPYQWNVHVGSPLEGLRTPWPEWHYEIAEKTCNIYKRYGVTLKEILDSIPERDTVLLDLYRLNMEK